MRLPAYLVLGCVAVAGCSSSKPSSENQPPSAQPAQVAPKPTEAEPGRTAFQKTYIAARAWQPDALPYEEQSQPTREVPGEGGASAVWSASFGSTARSLAKTFTWSGTDAEDAPPRGMGASPEDTFNPSNTSTKTFDLGFLKADSDKAFDVAQAHGGKRWTEKNPKLPIAYRLQWERRDNALEWHVIYGGTDNPKLRIAVDASTGLFVRKEE